jgi:glycosyltransferase involved in cell wall biosynthesis
MASLSAQAQRRAGAGPRMHIALYSPAWGASAHPSGIITYVRFMREELMRLGHRVSVFTNGAQTPGDDVHPVLVPPLMALASRIRGRIWPAKPGILRWGDAIAHSMRAVHRVDPIDVIEMEESFGWFASVLRRVPVPMVVKLHGPAFQTLVEEDSRTPFAAAKIEAEGRGLRVAPVITAPSQLTLDSTIQRYGLRPRIARRVANPLSLPPGTAAWQVHECDPDTLLFIGRFDKLKGGDVVLRAFALLLRRNPRLKLIFVGPDAGVVEPSGRTIRFDEMKASLFPGDSSNRVVFKGRLAPEDIHPLRSQAYATMVASRWENQSYTLLEAMLQGCPIVTSDIGGQGEAVLDGERGLLCRAGDPDDLAAKLQQLLDSPQLAARLGAAARKFALAEHAPVSVVAKTLDVYREAVALRTRVKAVPVLQG